MNKPLPSPFNDGLWILCTIGGRDVIAQVDDPNGNSTEETLKSIMAEAGYLRVTLRRKLMINALQFPVQARGVAGQTGFSTATLVTVIKHERAVECFYDFPTHCILNAVTFLSEIHPDDIEILAETARNGEEAALMELRAKNSNIQIAKG